MFFVVPICVLGIPANGTNDADFFFSAADPDYALVSYYFVVMTS